MSKIIMLDMDGVLNNRSSMALAGVFGIHPNSEECGGIHTVDPTCVKLLECAVKFTGAKIVISSTWRGPNLASTHNVKYAFEYAGCPDLWNEVIDVTPKHHDRFRGREIQEWLDNHPDVTHFVVVDDDTHDVLHKDNFVHVPHEYGLQFEHIEKMIYVLGGPKEVRWQDVENNGMHPERHWKSKEHRAVMFEALHQIATYKPDQTNTVCIICNRGQCVETSIHDDIDGVLHCNTCGTTINRYAPTPREIAKIALNKIF